MLEKDPEKKKREIINEQQESTYMKRERERERERKKEKKKKI